MNDRLPCMAKTIIRYAEHALRSMTTSSDLVHDGHEVFDDVVQSRASRSSTSDI